MFNKRSDGIMVKGLDPVTKMAPFFMRDRIGASNYFMDQIRCEAMDEFISRQRKLGNHYTYTHIMMTALVRLLYLRPKLNYFINHNVIYEHKDISICMVVKKQLSDEGEDVDLKFHFTGRESLQQVKEYVDGLIEKHVAPDSNYGTTDTAAVFCKFPKWVRRFALWVIRWMDRHNMMPKSLIKDSCFHCSAFLTNLKSIKNDAIFHHLYEFGNCSLFVAMGKEKIAPVVEKNKELKLGKVMNLGITMDERVADGFYFAKSLRIWKDMFANPDCLLESMPEDGSKKLTIKKRKKKTKSKVKKSKVKKDKTLIKLKKEQHKAEKEKEKEEKERAKDEKKLLKFERKLEKAERKTKKVAE